MNRGLAVFASSIAVVSLLCVTVFTGTGTLAVDTGFISENVYLFCASEGLATVVRGSIDRATRAKAMKLRPDQKIILAQTVGYPKK
jgi:nitroreductase